MKKPEWAQAKVRLGVATCWAGIVDGENNMQGVNWLHERLFWLSVHFFNHLVFPFCEDVPGFPFRVLELYDPAFLDGSDWEWEDEA